MPKKEWTLLELLLAAAVIGAAVYTVSALGPKLAPPSPPAPPSPAGTDLPCPWCLAATHEDDPACPNCLQVFGPAHATT